MLAELHFLTELRGILTTQVDMERTLAAVARRAVPTLADYCVVDMVGADDTVRRVEIAHADPSLRERLRDACRQHVEGKGSSVARIARSGRATLIVETKYAELDFVRGARARSWAIVPVTIRKRTVAVMSFVCVERSRRIDAQDLSFLQEVAAWTALARGHRLAPVR